MSTTGATTTTTTAGSPYPTRSSDDAIDETPLISVNNENSTTNHRSIRRPSLREAARFLRRASSRRMMREPSMLVRETAAEQLEERQSDWAYSKPVMILDIVWNLVFVAATVAVMVLSREEKPRVPLRVWVVGYGMQCIVHIICVSVEYRRRRRRRVGFRETGNRRSSSSASWSSRMGSLEYVSLAQLESNETGIVAKHVESASTMFSFIWWIIGFYWVSSGGQTLADSSPQLYWLCIIFLGFDVFFVVFCVALACVIGIAVCCCLPCIVAILYAVADQEGASQEDVDQLSKYKFRRISAYEKLAPDTAGASGGIMTECGTDSPIEHVLSAEEAECCICLSAYDDGVELRELPCGHHFHCTCIDKWLFINATCPLCKYNILKSTHQDREDV